MREEKDRLPTRQQIDAIADITALEDMHEEIDRRCTRIETDLDFRDGTDDWENRAVAALAMHRHTRHLILRRIAALRKGSGSPFASAANVKTTVRERTECHPLSWKLMDGEIALPEVSDKGAVEVAIAELTEAIDALEGDRVDEVTNFAQGSRDETWLSAAAFALKRAKAFRHELTLKLATFRRAEKLEARRVYDRERERMFVEEAKAVLPRETFLMLWDRTDRRFAEESVSEGTPA